MVSKKIERQMDAIENVFKILFLLYSFLSFCSLTYGKSIISYVLWPTVTLGGIICIWKLIHIRDYIKSKGFWFSVFFLASYFLSFVLNIKYGYKEGIIKFAFLVFFLVIFFLSPTTRTAETNRKSFQIIASIYVIFMGLGSFFSIILFLANVSHVYTVENGWDIGIGLVWGRLWGVFSEPNYAALCAGVACFLSLYFIKKAKNKIIKILLVANIFFSLLHIAFTDSRTGMVALATMVVSFFFIRYNKQRIEFKKTKYISFIKLTIVIIVSCCLTVIILNSIVKVYNKSVEILSSSSESTEEIRPEIDRGYSLEEDPSNRRFSIWESGIEIAESAPLAGVSFTNILNYTEQNLQDSYLLNNSKGTNFSTMHNELLNVLVGQGIIGLIILLSFVIYLIINTFKNFYNCFDDEGFFERNVFLSCLLGLSVGAMFLTGMFYSNLPNAIIFWSILGQYINCILPQREEQNL